MEQALSEIKRDMGFDAVILQTRRIKSGGILGLFSDEHVEVTAAVEENNSPAPIANPKTIRQSNAEANDPKMMAVHFELAHMRKSLEDVLSALQKPDTSTSPLLEWAYKNDIQTDAAEKLFKGVKKATSDELESFILPYFQNVSGINVRNGQTRTVALVGPTGVGKTTTVAKLAANFALKERFRVGLITMDTYRIAAVEQLKTYADLIGIPLEIVYTSSELKGALHRQRDKHLVLVDTAGRSPANQPQMSELEDLLGVDDSIEKHLVLSATTKFSDVMEAIHRFSPLKPQKYIFTKIDEACNLGTIFNVMYYEPRPLSYLTTGQNVPDDIELADPNRLAGLMLRG